MKLNAKKLKKTYKLKTCFVRLQRVDVNKLAAAAAATSTANMQSGTKGQVMKKKQVGRPAKVKTDKDLLKYTAPLVATNERSKRTPKPNRRYLNDGIPSTGSAKTKFSTYSSDDSDADDPDVVPDESSDEYEIPTPPPVRTQKVAPKTEPVRKLIRPPQYKIVGKVTPRLAETKGARPASAAAKVGRPNSVLVKVGRPISAAAALTMTTKRKIDYESEDDDVQEVIHTPIKKKVFILYK